MKLAEIVKRKDADPLMAMKAKKMLKRMKQIGANNPAETETPSGWRADPHQGSLGGSLNWR